MTEQTNAQKLGTLALQQNEADIRSTVDDLMDAVAIILVTGTADFDPKQVLEHFWAKAAEVEQRFNDR